MEKLWQDLRFSLRVIFKNPGFALIAISALALGIGANTAIFSVVNALLLRPLPYQEPQALVMVWENHQGRGGPEREWTSPVTIEEWRKSSAFSELAALTGWATTITGLEEPQRLQGASVSHEIFKLLRVEPALGRTFTKEEDQSGVARTVVLSHQLWQRLFQSDPQVIGKVISLSEGAYTVVGVMPAGFKLPILTKAELWRPINIAFDRKNCGFGCYIVRTIGRLKPGVAPITAQTELNTIIRNLEPQDPAAFLNVGIKVEPVQDFVVGSLRPALLTLLGAVLFVLVIACANVANLMLARATTRKKELAIRTALGASRWRLMRQLLTESLVLAIVAGLVGLLVSFWSIDLLIAISPDGTPRLDEIRIDKNVLFFTLALTLFTGLLFGIFPALQGTKLDVNQFLKEGGRGSETRTGSRFRNGLVIAEVALSLMLLIGAGLLMKSFLSLQKVDPGFNSDNILAFRITLPATYKDRAQVLGFYGQLLERLKGLPNVQDVGAVSGLPLSGTNTDIGFTIEGRPQPGPGNTPTAWYNTVSPDYFRTMGIKLIRGRVFTDQDHEKSARVVIITETTMKRYWPDEDPIGKQIKVGNDERYEIIGVVGDVKHFGVENDARVSMYGSLLQRPQRTMDIAVRTAGDPMQLTGSVKQVILSLDKNLATSAFNTMEQLRADDIADQRFIFQLVGGFAVIALLLAAIGIYGVVSYTTNQRTYEFGIRFALGAQPQDIIRIVLGYGMVMAGAGIVIGIAGAVAITRLLTSLLFGVSALDASVFAGVAIVLSGVALLACIVPAYRATKLDPMIAMRSE